jgi:spermidine synthase
MNERRAVYLLSLVFFFSGAAALMYQVAWQRLLTVYYGVGSISITLIVSVYMFGLGFGALAGGHLAEKIKRPDHRVAFYFLVEVLIGIFGVISPSFLDFLGRYTAGSSYELSFLYMVAFLIVPTLLMGITLPLIIKIYNGLVHNFLRSVSFLYFINTMGAAFGALAAAYIVISFWGLDSAVYVAAVLNFILGVLIFRTRFLFVPVRGEEAAPLPRPDDQRVQQVWILAYPLVLITGFLAIGYEIIWFRVMGVILKSSSYMFASVLSVYLVGIAAGSLSMNRFLDKKGDADRRGLFFAIQFLIGLYVLGSFMGYYYLTRDTVLGGLSKLSFSVTIHPLLQIPSADSISDVISYLYVLSDVFFWPLIFVLIPTVFMGASFPLISLLALSNRNKEGRTVGTVYFFNIVGNVLGAAITGFILLPVFGTERVLLFFGITGIVFGLFIKRTIGRELILPVRSGIVSGILAVSILFFPGPGKLYDLIHSVPEQFSNWQRHFSEGREGVVMTYEHNNKIRLYIEGHLEGIRPLPVGYYWNMEALSHSERAEHVLIIGFGAGTSAEAALHTEGIQNVTVVEINGTLIRNLSRFEYIKDILSNNKLKLIIDDGRRYLLRTKDKYDIVIMEAGRTPMAYSNNIFSREFFHLVKGHLRKGGIFLVREPAGTGLLKTFLTEFDHIKRHREFVIVSDRYLKRDKRRWNALLQDIPPKFRSHVLRLADEKPDILSRGDLQDKVFSYYRVNTDWKPVSEYYFGVKVKGLLFVPRHIRERFKTLYGF